MPWRESGRERERAAAERPVLFDGPDGRLFGIYTPPAPDAPASGSCAVLFTRPRSHRNRMWVEGARRLAAGGFASFRFDYHGCGDSEGPTLPLDPNRPYQGDALAALRVMRERFGHTRFVVSGACFDARTALSVFPEEGPAIEGLVFIAAPVVELSTLVVADADRKDWKDVARALGNPETWKSLARPERWRSAGRTLARLALRSTGAGAPADLPLSASFVEHFQALARSRARALFLYGAADVEYDSFAAAERQLFARLDEETRRRFDVVVWEGTVHGMLEMTRQRETFERALAWIEALHPAARPVSGTGAVAFGARSAASP